MNYGLGMIYILILVGVSIFAVMQHERYKAECYKNEALETQLEVMRNTAERLRKQYLEAHTSAQAKVNTINSRTDKILQTPISTKCEDAANWARLEAEHIKHE